jgi:DNA-binding NarL/FixJ family response regulator
MSNSEPPCSRTVLRRHKILLVDDDPGVIRGLWRVLRRQRPEYQVNTAAGAAQALEALSELTYDVVITDLQMPGGGGDAVLDALSKLYPETARVVHSSQLESSDTFHCRAAHFVLAKPASESEIVAAVELALQRVASESKRALGG